MLCPSLPALALVCPAGEHYTAVHAKLSERRRPMARARSCSPGLVVRRPPRLAVAVAVKRGERFRHAPSAVAVMPPIPLQVAVEGRRAQCGSVLPQQYLSPIQQRTSSKTNPNPSRLFPVHSKGGASHDCQRLPIHTTTTAPSLRSKLRQSCAGGPTTIFMTTHLLPSVQTIRLH
jgi:hypothetical protein